MILRRPIACLVLVPGSRSTSHAAAGDRAQGPTVLYDPELAAARFLSA